MPVYAWFVMNTYGYTVTKSEVQRQTALLSVGKGGGNITWKVISTEQLKSSRTSSKGLNIMNLVIMLNKSSRNCGWGIGEKHKTVLPFPPCPQEMTPATL